MKKYPNSVKIYYGSLEDDAIVEYRELDYHKARFEINHLVDKVNRGDVSLANGEGILIKADPLEMYRNTDGFHSSFPELMLTRKPPKKRKKESQTVKTVVKPAERARIFRNYLEVVDRLYELFGGPNSPQTNISVRDLANLLDTTPSTLQVIKVILNKLGILKSAISATWGEGKNATWELMVPKLEARKILVEWEKEGIGFREFAKVKSSLGGEITLASSEEEETRAIVGPEPENPLAAISSMLKDEPRALIEAARQYRDKKITVDREYNNLVSNGFQVDKEQFYASIKLPKDSILEVVSNIVNAWDTLEERVERLSKENQMLRAKVSELGVYKNKYERLSDQRKKEVSARVPLPVNSD